MNLYLISQNENNGYFTYDSAVVAAKTEEDARNTLPDTFCSTWEHSAYTWVERPDQVKVKLIGSAVEGTKAGVILASFHAG